MKLRIIILSTLFSGIVLLLSSIAGYQYLYHSGIRAMDNDIQVFAEREMQPHLPEAHWRNVERALQPMFGQSPGIVAVRVQTHGGNTVYQSPDWPGDLDPAAIDIPEPPPPRMEPQPPIPRKHAGRPDLAGKARRPPPQQRFEQSGSEPPPLPGSAPVTVSTREADWRISAFSNPDISLIAAINLNDFHMQMDRIRNFILILLPLALILIAAGSGFTAHRAVRSVALLTETTRRISASDLKQRVPEHDTDAELRELVAVYNSMLDRIETSFNQAVRFSGDAAHELKTPVTVLMGEMDAALRNVPEGSPLQALLAELLEQVSRLNRIIRNLLLLARADAGRLSLEKEPVNVSVLLQEQAEDIEVLNDTLSIERHIPDGIIVPADPGLVRHLISNLVTNAVKYNINGGTVRLTLQQHPETKKVEIIIANTGPGIPAGDRGQIFDRFHRGQRSGNHDTEGSGLGLSIAREIARLHGGALTLQPGDTAWTVFRVLLPI